MSADPLVSVVMPTYNRLRFLTTAVASVFAQTYKNWELVIADDGSAKDVREYLASLESKSAVTVLLLPHVGNPGAVRNSALRQARGRYVAFLDSDDAWMPGKLETQVAVLESNPRREWCYSEFIRVDPHGKSVDSARDPHRILYEGDVFEQLLSLRAGIAMPTVIARRSLLHRAGGFDERLGLHEDYELWLRLALLSQISRVREPLGYVRAHDEHFSSLGLRNLLARREVLEKMRTLLDDPNRLRLLQSQRILNETELALAHAEAGSAAGVFRILRHSWRDSWQDAAWRKGALKAVAFSCVPGAVVRSIRRSRRVARNAVR